MRTTSPERLDVRPSSSGHARILQVVREVVDHRARRRTVAPGALVAVPLAGEDEDVERFARSDEGVDEPARCFEMDVLVHERVKDEKLPA